MRAQAETSAEAEILVISSCTAKKAKPPDDPQLLAAAELYTGDQHRRLMAGIAEYRHAGEPAGPIRLRIVSAGLGLVDERQQIQSYDIAFTGMSGAAINQRGTALGIPAAIAEELKRSRTLTVFALGHDYLRACAVHTIRFVNGPVLALTARASARMLPAAFVPLILGVQDTRQFGAGFVGLKGAVVATLLRTLVAEPSLVHDPTRLAESIKSGTASNRAVNEAR